MNRWYDRENKGDGVEVVGIISVVIVICKVLYEVYGWRATV